jgi:ABC-type amino acid transport substrate-binding protein
MLFACILVASSMTWVQAAPAEKRVLLISSYHPDFPTFFKQIEGVRAGLAQAGFEQPSLVFDVEFMDSKRFFTEALVIEFYERLARKLSKLPPYDIVMTSDDNATKSAILRQRQLFGDTPIVFFGVNDRSFAIEQDQVPWATGVVEAASILETAELAVRLSPEQPLIVVTDATPSGQGDLATFREGAEARPTISYRVLSLADLSFDEFEDALRSLPETGSMLLLSAYRDRTGESLSFNESLERIVAAYSGPIFHMWRHGIGEGALGGIVVSHFEQGKRAAELAASILKGESPASVRVVRDSPNIPLFDYLMLQRYGIGRSDLPADTLYLNEPPAGIPFTSEELAWLREYDKIVVGGERDWAPFDFVDESGNYAGIANDYLKVIGERLGLEVEFVTGPSWNALLTMARQNKIDLLPALYYTEERASYLHYTKPYTRVTEFIYGREEGARISSMADLAGKSVAVVKGYKIEQALRTDYPNIKVISSPNIQAALRKVILRDADAFIGDLASTSYNIQRHSLVGIRPMAEAPFYESAIHMAARGDWPVLRDLIQKVFDAMTPREHNDIMSRWISDQPGIQPQLALTAEERAWLEEHPQITLGFTPEIEPLIIQGEDGTLSGVLIDVYDELEKLTGLEVKIEIDVWPDTIEKAKRGEIDGLLACAPSLARSIGLSDSQALVEGTPTVFAKTAVPFEINSEEDLIGKRVAVLKGIYVIEQVLAPYKGKLDIIPADSAQEMMALVLEGRADVAYGLSYHNFLIGKKMLVGIEPVYFSRRYSADGVAAVRADWPQLLSIINKGLKEIGTARLNAITGKWTQIGRVKKRLVLTQKEREWLEAHPVLRVTVDPDYLPYGALDSAGRYRGIGADFNRLLAERLGIRFEVIPTRTWDESLAFVREKKADLLPILSRAAEHSGFLNFAEPHIDAPAVLITRRDHPEVRGKADLPGKRVALPLGYTASTQLQERYPNLVEVPVDSLKEALTTVATGEADAAAVDLAAAEYLIHADKFTNLIVAGRIEAFGVGRLGYGARKDWPELIPILNKALATISSEERFAILGKWGVRLLDPDVGSSFRARLTAEDREWLQAHPVVRVLLDPHWAPVEYRDEEGRFQGISMDYLRHLETLLGIRLEVAQELLWGEGVAQLRAKQLDMVTAMTRTPERETFALFSEPFLSMPVKIFARNDVTYIGGLENLADRQAAVVEGYAVPEWLSRDHRISDRSG